MTVGDETPRTLLLSGLAADASVFASQLIALPNLVVPDWPLPNQNESMQEYCRRLAESLRRSDPAIIGGASFGGIIAQELARHLEPKAVVLIGSVRGPDQLPWYARYSRPLRFFVPLIPVRLLQLLAWPFASQLARRVMPHYSGMACQFRGSHPRLFKWSLCQLLEWNATPTVVCPIFHIHGDSDWLLPLKLTNPDTVIPGAGHAISMTHPREVNEFLRGVVAQVSRTTPTT